MKILLDTNIILDAILMREPYWRDAKNIFASIYTEFRKHKMIWQNSSVFEKKLRSKFEAVV